MMRTVRVLVAPDKFKGSLTAAAVAAHLGVGLRQAVPGAVVDELPVADGGEGTVAAALAAGFVPVELEATGPLGEPVTTRYAVAGSTAVIEMAAVSGLEMLDPDDASARHATSRGVGELLAHAIDHGARTVVIGIGGSASTDGGAGMLRALGARLNGAAGELPDGGDALRSLAWVDLTGLDPRLVATEVVLASDVDNPLLGPDGAAAVYGPQKGADRQAVLDLEEGLTRWAGALSDAGVSGAERLVTAPGAGAAGGVGYAALAVLGARRRPGVDVILELTRFQDRLAGADLVITGEGSLDEQSLRGKAPVGIARAAARHGVATVAVCGRTTLGRSALERAGLRAAYALTDIETDVQRCMTHPGPLLEKLAEQIARHHLVAAAIAAPEEKREERP